MSEVLAQKDYYRVSTIFGFMEEHGEIAPKEAEAVTGKSAATMRRYFKMFTGTRYSGRGEYQQYSLSYCCEFVRR